MLQHSDFYRNNGTDAGIRKSGRITPVDNRGGQMPQQVDDFVAGQVAHQFGGFFADAVQIFDSRKQRI